MTNRIERYEPTGKELAPGATVKEALAWEIEVANTVAELVEKQGWFQAIGAKRYLEAEAWEFIGLRTSTDALTEWVRPIEDPISEEVVAYEARVVLQKNGASVGAAEMTCGLDEFPCQGKTGWAKHKAARSAAQTWALSKAYRMKYGFIARLAGFEPTPAEEMAEGTSRTESQPLQQYYCTDHKTTWFKRGAMKQFAHPIGETGKWCNMPKQPASSPAVPVASAAGGPPTAAASPPPANTPAAAPTEAQASSVAPEQAPQAGEAPHQPMTHVEFWGKARRLGYKVYADLIPALGCTILEWEKLGKSFEDALLAAEHYAAEKKGA